jgi:hypothetical protein
VVRRWPGFLSKRAFFQKSDDRPADILLTAWRGGALALDATVPHIRTKRTPENATGLHAMDVAVARKKSKYLDRCQEAGLNFAVLAFDTLGATHPECEDFLRAIFKDARDRALCPDWRYMDLAWHRVVVPLQVDVARQIIARCVPPELETLNKTVVVAPSVPCPSIALEYVPLPRPSPLKKFPKIKISTDATPHSSPTFPLSALAPVFSLPLLPTPPPPLFRVLLCVLLCLWHQPGRLRRKSFPQITL